MCTILNNEEEDAYACLILLDYRPRVFNFSTITLKKNFRKKKFYSKVKQ